MAILESRTKTGLSWVKECIALFKTAPRKWLLLGLAYVSIFMMLPGLPGLQFFAFLSIFLMPVFLVFAAIMYRNADMQKQQTMQEILTHIKPKLKQLITLGAVCFFYGILISLVLNSDIENLLKLMQLQDIAAKTQSSEIMQTKMIQTVLPLFLKLILFLIPLLMATWFSPMLIAFNNYNCLKAIKSSVAGCIQYTVALGAAWLVFSAGIVLLMLVSGIIVGIIGSLAPQLGQLLTSLLVFGCLLLATTLMLAFQYVSYRDVFRAA